MRRKRKKQEPWQPAPEFLAPVDPAEFTFCMRLMEAAYSGKMPTPNPENFRIYIEDFGAVALTDTPFNRGMLAVKTHFKETRIDEEQSGRDFIAVGFRLTNFADFVQDCMKKKSSRFVKFGRLMGNGLILEDALIEAAATATLGKHGFDADSLFDIADKLFQKRDRSWS